MGVGVIQSEPSIPVKLIQSPASYNYISISINLIAIRRIFTSLWTVILITITSFESVFNATVLNPHSTASTMID